MTAQPFFAYMNEVHSYEACMTSGNNRAFIHEVCFTGPMAFLWAALLGPGFRKALPPTMEKLAALAETASDTAS